MCVLLYFSLELTSRARTKQDTSKLIVILRWKFQREAKNSNLKGHPNSQVENKLKTPWLKKENKNMYTINYSTQNTI